MGHFGEFLVGEGKLSPDGLKKAIEMQQVAGGRLGTNILELGLMGEDELLAALGRYRRTSTVSAFQLRSVPREPLQLVPPEIARRHLFVPIERRGNTLTLASRDPGDLLVEDELGYLTSCLVKTVIGLELRIHQALEKYYRIPQPTRLSGLARRLDGAGQGRPARVEPEDDERPAAAPAPSEPRRPEPVKGAAEPAAPKRGGPEPPRRESEIRYIELNQEERARIYEADRNRGTPRERLAAAAEELSKLTIRDEIADVLLDFSRPYLGRRILLVRRKDHIVGWRGEGSGIDVEMVRAIEIPAGEPSVFVTFSQGSDFWLGTLAPLAAHRSLIDALGGLPPKDCLILSVTLRSRLVCFLYGDNREASVSGVPLAELKRLARKAGVAFEVSILKNKIRTL